MRIRSSNRTPYLSRRDQVRLGIFAALLGFVVIAMQQASRPEMWYWLTGNPALRPDAKPEEEGQPPAEKKIDFNVNAEESSVDGNAVRVVEKLPDLEDDGELTIAPELLTVVKDNAVGIREAERDLYYFLLAKVRDAPLKSLEKAARDDVAFTVLMTESPKFIGELITLKAELRRLQPYPAGRNEHGVDQLYEAWLKTDDAGDNPYRVVCSRIPDGIPSGMEVKSGTIVKITGYYFKRYGYPAQEHRLHVAPLILAGEIQWIRTRDAAPRKADAGIVPYVLGLAGVMGTGIAYMLWRFRRSDREFERQHLKRLTGAPSGAIESLDGIGTVDVNDALRQLAEADGGNTFQTGGEETDSDPNTDTESPG